MYVEYISVAPWNDKPRHERPLVAPPSLGGLMITVAVQISADLGYGGRLGLNAEKDIEFWYRDTLKLQAQGLQRDPDDAKWPYYEGDEAWAEAFLKTTGAT